MSVVVTLHVYSGRRNPSWELDEAQVGELVERVRRVDKTTLLKPPGVMGGLGYRGFTIRAVREKHLAPHMYLHAGVLDVSRFGVNLVLDGPDLEQWLLSTAGPAVSDAAARHVRDELDRGGKALALRADKPPIIMLAPPYDPGRWNDDPNICDNNNCYNYANNIITNTFALPGRGSGQPSTVDACDNVGPAAERDGEVAVNAAPGDPAQGHYMALVVWPNEDFHWYRKDSNGQWSHKQGGDPVTNLDNDGQPIDDPRTCARGDYTAWCGYYLCIPANVHIA